MENSLLLGVPILRHGTITVLGIRTDRSEKTVQTQSRLQDLSDQDLHDHLPFDLHFFDT